MDNKASTMDDQMLSTVGDRAKAKEEADKAAAENAGKGGDEA